MFLLLGGDGPLMTELQRLRTGLDLENEVCLPGFFPEEEIVGLLRSADLYVLPSCVDANGDTEGSATAALEAMACGTPSVVSRIGGNVGAIEDGNGAFYCEPADPADLAEKIILLLSDAGGLKDQAGKARKFVVGNYSWEKVVDRYRELMQGK